MAEGMLKERADTEGNGGNRGNLPITLTGGDDFDDSKGRPLDTEEIDLARRIDEPLKEAPQRISFLDAKVAGRTAVRASGAVHELRANRRGGLPYFGWVAVSREVGYPDKIK